MTIRTAFVLPDFNGGGAESGLLQHLRHWKLGPVHVVVRSASGPLRSAFGETGVPLLELGLPRAGKFAAARSVLRVREALRRVNPDVVVSLLSPVSTYAANAIGTRAPMVVSVQNPITTEASGPIGARLTSAVLRSATSVAVISPGLIVPLANAGIARTKIVLTPNPIDSRYFDEPLSRARSQSPRIGMLARLAPQKRIDVAIHALAAVEDQTATLHIGGIGALEAELRALAGEIGLAHRVYFHGFVEPVAFLREVDCLLLTSAYEGLGNVLAEALAVGLPVVSTDAPYGPRFIVADGGNGILCPVGDSTAIAEALAKVMRGDAPGTPVSRRESVRRFHPVIATPMLEDCVAAAAAQQ